MARSYYQADAETPVQLAWEAYQESMTYLPIRNFAKESGYVTGAMWAAFHAGFFAGAEQGAVRS